MLRESEFHPVERTWLGLTFVTYLLALFALCASRPRLRRRRQQLLEHAIHTTAALARRRSDMHDQALRGLAVHAKFMLDLPGRQSPPNQDDS